MCRIVGHAVMSSIHPGIATAQFNCEEHQMLVPGLVGADTLCPIGRIEQARDHALKAIAEAQRIHWVDAVSTKDYKIG